MSAWTMENTQGFTEAELDMINRVRVTMLQDSDGNADYAKGVGDAINNAWHEGLSETALERAARNLLRAR